MLTCPNCERESAEDFAFCPACGAPLSPAAPTREVRKTVTVVFCDVAGSTSLGEKLDPESTRKVMGRYFEEMKTALERHGGTVEKYIGDAVMAVFGIPQLHEDDALRAVRAAVEMRDALTQLNKELERDRGVTIASRIGVNTGQVVAGEPAAGQALVTGDAVNVAARLEQAAQPGEVLIGQDTFRLVQDAVVADRIDPLELKGKGEPVPAYRLLEIVPGAAGRARRFDSPMVGRERELMLLRQGFERSASDRACQLFTVLGPAGVGKSRLLHEFLASVKEATVLRARCLAYGQGITYFPVVEIVKQAAGLTDFDAPGVVEAKVCAIVEGEDHSDLVCDRVAQLMGVSQAAAPEETFWAIRRFLEAVAHAGPLVVVLDDIQWGEPTFLDLVEHVADWSRDAPILLVCVARPDLLDVRPGWGGGKLNATTMSLEPLSETESDLLIANLLGATEIEEIRGRIAEAAEGNPLFVEETLAMLIDEGHLARKDGRWVPTTDLSRVTLPPTIMALLAARIDRLSVWERAVIERASVVGKQFFLGAVRDLLPGDAPADLSAHLMALVRKELIRPDRSSLPGEDGFRFRHILIRDAAYESMPKELRAELHERFVDWLEGVAGDRVEEQEEILGYHLEQAYRYRAELGPIDDRGRELASRAATRLASAGRRALARGDGPAASNLLSRSDSLWPADDAARTELLFDLGRARSSAGQYAEAIESHGRAIELARASSNTSIEWRASLAISLFQTFLDPHGSSTDNVRRKAEQAIEVFEGLDDELGLARAWRVLGQMEVMPCRYGRAAQAAEHSIEHALRAVRDERGRRELSDSLGLLLGAIMFGPMPAPVGIARCDEIAGRAGDDRYVEGASLRAKGALLAMRGNFPEARRLLGRARAIGQDLGRPNMLVEVGEAAGGVEMLAGDLVAAEMEWRAQYEILQAAGDLSHLSTAATNLARALCAQGRFDEAETLADTGRAAAADDDVATQVGWRTAMAKVTAARGRLEQAEDLTRQAVDIASVGDWLNSQADTYMDLGEVLRVSGQGGEAVRAVGSALDLYEQKGNLVSAGAAKALLQEFGV